MSKEAACLMAVVQRETWWKCDSDGVAIRFPLANSPFFARGRTVQQLMEPDDLC
jgi:hypothetical protein